MSVSVSVMVNQTHIGLMCWCLRSAWVRESLRCVWWCEWMRPIAATTSHTHRELRVFACCSFIICWHDRTEGSRESQGSDKAFLSSAYSCAATARLWWTAFSQICSAWLISNRNKSANRFHEAYKCNVLYL